MIIKALKKGFSQAWNYRKITLIIYVLTLVLASLAAFPFKSLLDAKAGQSLIVKNMVKGFDYTFLNDFLQNYGEGFIPIWEQSILLIGFHFLFMVFLMGGIVKILVTQSPVFNRSVFWGATGQYFWRMFRLTIYFLIIHGLVLCLFVFIFLKITKGMSPQLLDDELIIMDAIQVLLPIYVLVAGFFLMWQDYSKLFLVELKDTYVYKVMFYEAFTFICLNFKDTYGLFLLNAILLASLICINNFIAGLFDVTSLATIVIIFVLSQLFIIGRVFLKIVRLGSAFDLSEQI